MQKRWRNECKRGACVNTGHVWMQTRCMKIYEIEIQWDSEGGEHKGVYSQWQHKTTKNSQQQNSRFLQQKQIKFTQWQNHHMHTHLYEFKTHATFILHWSCMCKGVLDVLQPAHILAISLSLQSMSINYLSISLISVIQFDILHIPLKTILHFLLSFMLSTSHS